MSNPLLTPLENALGYYKINSILCPHNPNVNRDTAYSIVYDAYYRYRDGFTCSIYSLMARFDKTIEEIGIQWMTPRGKFTKRLMKAMPELEFISGIIGDEIQRKAYQSTDYNWLISLTDQIFWDNGEFGNSSSCWWTMYPESRQVFIDNAGIGMLWHDNPDDRFHGIGRCWILPIHEHTYKYGYINGLFLFNQYGEVDGRTIRLEDTARYITSIVPDTDCQDVRLYNDDDEYTPYINDNQGILVKLKEHPVERYYEFHLNMGGENCIDCYECSDRISQNDAREYRHRWYCESCYDELFYDCDNCGYTYYKEDMQQQDWNLYCTDCFNELYTYCDNCCDYHDASTTTEINGSYYCESCAADEFTICETCNELTSNDEITEIDGCYYCNDCIPEIEPI